jgi:drug/metabolite transporter (DMT)-like permease
MEPSLYWLGVLLAVLAGIITQLGSVFQKKAVNEKSSDSGFMKSLVKSPTWLLGVFLSFGISSIFFLIAQGFIGPALIPGLMSLGLIVLVIGSIKLVGEKLKLEEYLGILLMITGTLLLSLSQLIGTISDVFSGTFNIPQLILCITSIIILILCNVYGLTTIQHAYRVGQASNLIPIQNVPSLISPIFIYFLVFLMSPPFIYSIFFLTSGVSLIIVSFFLLGKRSARMEELNKES